MYLYSKLINFKKDINIFFYDVENLYLCFYLITTSLKKSKLILLLLEILIGQKATVKKSHQLEFFN